MAVSLAQFMDRLDESRLLARSDAQTLVDVLPADQRPADGEQLARLQLQSDFPPRRARSAFAKSPQRL